MVIVAIEHFQSPSKGGDCFALESPSFPLELHTMRIQMFVHGCQNDSYDFTRQLR
ncbi:hypothetical protein D3C80_1499250 [compost metagenome]